MKNGRIKSLEWKIVVSISLPRRQRRRRRTPVCALTRQFPDNNFPPLTRVLHPVNARTWWWQTQVYYTHTHTSRTHSSLTPFKKAIQKKYTPSKEWKSFLLLFSFFSFSLLYFTFFMISFFFFRFYIEPVNILRLDGAIGDVPCTAPALLTVPYHSVTFISFFID